MKVDQNYTQSFDKARKHFFIRAINEHDKADLLDGFNHASREVKIRRFLGYKKTLSEKELDYLTHPDFEVHYAYGIEEQVGDKHHPFGVARFIKDKDNPERAECAITLLDEYHGMGLGTDLFAVMVDAAKEAGVKELYGTAYSDNHAIKHLMSKFGKFTNSTQAGIDDLSLLI
jgi:RimJ/RimL family protein N-acetyltransferase